MQAENETTGHNRTIRVTGIPTAHKDDVSEMNVNVMYGHGNNEGGLIHKAVALDDIIIPRIVAALNHEEATAEEIAQARDDWSVENLRIDDKAAVSRGRNDPPGCWVAAWVWIAQTPPSATREE